MCTASQIINYVGVVLIMARKLIIILIFIWIAAVPVFAGDTRGLKPDGTWKPQKAKLLAIIRVRWLP